MADPYDKLFNDPEWQAYERNVLKNARTPAEGEAQIAQTLDQIKSKYLSPHQTLQVAGGAGAVPTADGGMRTFSTSKPIAPEMARKAKLSDMGKKIIALTDEMDALYKNRIKPRLDKGEINSFGQGFRYVYPGYLSDKVDPDVKDWMVKAGQLSVAVNQYYSQGQRPSVQGYQVMTKPHIPTPPASLMDLTGSPGLFGDEGHRKFDLETQADMLDEIRHKIQLDAGEVPQRTYPARTNAPGETEDPVDAAMRKHGISP